MRAGPAALLLLVLLLPVAARADCAPIQVILNGTVTKRIERRPVSDLPITIRMQFDDAGLAKLHWEAVVTDADGRFHWLHEFPADPCHDGIFLKRLPLKPWVWLRASLSRSYRKRARGLPDVIVLNLGQQIRRIKRDDLLDHLDVEKNAVEIDLPLEL